MKHRLTASKIELGLRCLWWARPDVSLTAGGESDAAALGTAFHAAADEEADVEDDDELDEDALAWGFRHYVMDEPDYSAGLSDAARLELSRLVAAWRQWWDATVGYRWHVREVAYALGPSGARAVPTSGPRDYSGVRDDEVPGTVDLAFIADGLLTVVDYKTGRGPHRAADHEHQLRHLGASVAKALGADRVRVAIAHVTGEDHGLETPVIWDELYMDELDIEIAAAEALRLLAQVPTAEARPGLHCDDLWCPARSVCPATRALLADAKLELEPRRRLPVVGPIETPEQARAVLVAVPLLEAWLADRARAVKAFVDARGPLRDGELVYQGWEQKRETPRLDVAGAMELLAAEGLDGAVKVKRSTSWKALREALRPKVPKGTLTDAAEHLRAQLREVGALKVSEFKKYEWKKEKGT